MKEEKRYKKISLEMEAVDRLLVEIFLGAYPTPPEQIVLGLDATDDPLHGNQVRLDLSSMACVLMEALCR